jgi:hypothetical protein
MWVPSKERLLRTRSNRLLKMGLDFPFPKAGGSCSKLSLVDMLHNITCVREAKSVFRRALQGLFITFAAHYFDSESIDLKLSPTCKEITLKEDGGPASTTAPQHQASPARRQQRV